MYLRRFEDFTPGHEVVEWLFSEVFTEEQKETLTLKAGKASLDLKEEFLERFGKLWGIGTLRTIKFKALDLIARNERHLKNISRLKQLEETFNDPESFGEYIRENPEIETTNNTNINRLAKNKTLSVGVNRTREGSSGDDMEDESEEIEGWENEDNAFIKGISKYNLKNEFEFKPDDANVGFSKIDITPQEDGELPIRVKAAEHHITAHNIGVAHARTIGVGNNSASSRQILKNKHTQTGKRESIKLNRAKATLDSLNVQIINLRERYIIQFHSLFTDVRRCL